MEHNNFLCVLLQLSLVDLAGSERAAKTGATPEQLRVSQLSYVHAAYTFDFCIVRGVLQTVVYLCVAPIFPASTLAVLPENVLGIATPSHLHCKERQLCFSCLLSFLSWECCTKSPISPDSLLSSSFLYKHGAICLGSLLSRIIPLFTHSSWPWD